MYDNAVEEFRRTLREHPNVWVARMGLGVARLAQGRHEDAIAELKKAVAMSGGAEEARAALASAYARAGRRREALEIAGSIEPAAGSKFASGMSAADVCISLGEKDRALEWLAKAYEQRQYRLAFLKVDPVYDSVRSDPRFKDLFRRLGLAL